MEASPRVVAVARDGAHRFSKTQVPTIRLVAGLGVDGDAHAGVTVKHRSRVARDPRQPNLRQVHLLHAEMLDELNAQGFRLAPADVGENITTRGVDLLALPTGTRLRLGSQAVVELTGLRNPCAQLDAFRTGLMAALLGRDAQGDVVRKAGVMAVVVSGGTVQAYDAIGIALPPAPHQPLKPV